MAARRPWFELRRSPIQGTGAFALRDIPRDKKLIEYEGERITADEASERYDDSRVRRHHTFLFELDEKSCIDARDVGNDARYINHSCAPNCEAVIEGRRIFIYSREAIREGLELTYDYQYVIDGPLDAATRKLYACKCGAKTCRGTIAVSRPTKRRAPSAAASKNTLTRKKSALRGKVPSSRTKSTPKAPAARR